MTGLEFFAVFGFIAFVWGSAWLGFRLEKWSEVQRARKGRSSHVARSDEDVELRMGDSVGAWACGVAALIIAVVIRYW